VTPLTATNIIGIDPSLTRTAVAMIDGCDSYTTRLTGLPRLAYLRDEVLAAAGARTRLAVIEGYSMGGQRGSSGVGQALGELGGVIRLALYEQGIEILDVSPASLKKFACGHIEQKKRDKDAMFKAALQNLPWDVDNHDEADASWLRAIGLYLHGISVVPVTQYRDDVCMKIDESRRAAA
jgi:Holliday junction resolvasome RuvABC endonuclease subunit